MVKIATQTGWKLEPAFCYDNSDNGETVSAQQPNAALSTAVPVHVTVSTTNSSSTSDCQNQPEAPTPSLSVPPLSPVPPQTAEEAST